MSSETIPFVVLGMFVVSVMLSGIIQLVYGKKIQDDNITEKDKRGGQFMIFLGAFVILLALFYGLGTVMSDALKDLGVSKNSILTVKALLGVALLTVIGSSVLQIIYGSKINKNTISEEDDKGGITLIVTGSINLVMVVALVVLLYMMYKKNNLFFI